MFRPPGECPACGEFVPEGYLACPHCGADAQSGWKEEAATDGLDLPDDSFNYDEFIQEEFGQVPKRSQLKPIWWITALVLLVVFIVSMLGFLK